ncbi:hypothetical protein [Longibaculum muris]|mgnify:FL=1|uniref:hypothetical protein n=1 Tax=Longibaculum muris TaxID=1796628 RepID=UPI0022E30F67|nr:hypothetical protein [Longibaculum muris]
MKLYRPVGLYEMKKILETDCKAFPPRQKQQPYFYPVLNKSYAKKIAFWNVKDKDSGYVGFITEFDVEDSYIEKYDVHCVGNEMHLELWIPAEDLHNFNKNIINQIKIVDVYYGDNYKGLLPRGVSGFKETEVYKQIELLQNIIKYNEFDFYGTVLVEWELLNLNLLFWKSLGVDSYLINKIVEYLQLTHKCFISESLLK